MCPFKSIEKVKNRVMKDSLIRVATSDLFYASSKKCLEGRENRKGKQQNLSPQSYLLPGDFKCILVFSVFFASLQKHMSHRKLISFCAFSSVHLYSSVCRIKILGRTRWGWSLTWQFFFLGWKTQLRRNVLQKVPRLIVKG